MGNREGGPDGGLVKSRKTVKGLQNKSLICGMDGFGIQLYVLHEKRRERKKGIIVGKSTLISLKGI